MSSRMTKKNAITTPYVAVLWLIKGDYRLLLDFLVCMGTIVVAVQAVRSKEYIWAFGFTAIAILFNPFVPFFKLAGNPPLSVVFVYIAAFVISWAALSTPSAPMILEIGHLSGR